MSQDTQIHLPPRPFSSLRKRLTAARWQLRCARSAAAKLHAQARVRDDDVAKLEVLVATLTDELRQTDPAALAELHDVSVGGAK